jgi:hypothetical protein
MDKNEMKKQWKEQQKQNLIKSMPLSKDKLRDLFEYLDKEDLPECDHTLINTQAFLRSNNLEEEKIVIWLREKGGYCDCEVLNNLVDEFGPIVGFE